MAKKPTKESVYEEIRKAGEKGKALGTKSKMPFLEKLTSEGKIEKIDSRYYAKDVIPSPSEIYKKVERAGDKGIKLTSFEAKVSKDLLDDGEIVKIGTLYYLPEYLPNSDKVYKKIERAGDKGIKLTSFEAKVSKDLLDKGEIVKVGTLYYLPEYVPGADEVYKKIERAGDKGTKLTSSEAKISKCLLDDGEIAKVGSLYCLPEYVPDPDEVYKKTERAGESGTDLAPLEIEVIKPLIKKGKIKRVDKKYYLPDFEPLAQKKVIERLLNSKILKKVGKKYIFLPKPPESIPSFAEFVETLQKIYLRKAGGYRKSVNIVSLVEAVTSEIDIPRRLAEKWILELPRIFVGIVDLRPFPGESGLKLEGGAELSRIYLERGLVGL